MTYSNLLDQNVYDSKYQSRFLVIGSCLPNLYPKIIDKFEKEWGNVVSFCLEQSHYNQMVAKLFSILAIGKVTKVGFLTVDGSPHCTQLHYASKYLNRGLKHPMEYEHYVIKSNGQVFKVTPESIDKSKDLSSFGEEYILNKPNL
jgi:hypothetical protein